jgi:GNAT superfamily N-acetyltransferase
MDDIKEVVVRDARRVDMLHVHSLLAAQLAEHDIDIDAPRLAAAIAGVFERTDRGALLIAESRGAPVGVAYLSYIWSIELGGLSVWLDELYVVPAERGRGIGKKMLDRVCEKARAEGCAGVDLEVESTHERAARLYERAGFQRHSRVRWVLPLR